MSASRIAAAWPVGIRRVVALDRRGDDLRQAPAAHQHRADERMVDAELAALATGALVGRLVAGIARGLVAVELGQHELADVVKRAPRPPARRAAAAAPPRRPARRRSVRRPHGGGSARSGSRGRAGRGRARHRSRSADASVAHAVDCSASTASRTPPARPEGPSPLLAARMTAIASTASASIASASSLGRGRLALARARAADAAPPTARASRRHGLESVGEPSSADAGSPLGGRLCGLGHRR